MFFNLLSQGKRDESTNVDAAKAKADAKVCSPHLDYSVWLTCYFSAYYWNKFSQLLSHLLDI